MFGTILTELLGSGNSEGESLLSGNKGKGRFDLTSECKITRYNFSLRKDAP